MRSCKYLIEFHESRSKNSSFQLGKKKEEMRLSESIRRSERSSYHKGVLTELEMRLHESLMNLEERSSYQQAVLIRGGGSKAHSDHWRTQYIPSKHPSRGQCT
jgi:hypothetical protein